MQRRSGGGFPIRLILAVGIAGFSACTYYANRQTNPITGEKQSVSLTPGQEISLGLQATPEMEAQYGGLDPDPKASRLVESVGQEIVAKSDAARSPYKFAFHLLADGRTVNAFALPGGQVFITRALYAKLENGGMLAGVLAHEIGHVVARHSAQQMAKQKLVSGIAGAATVATTDPRRPGTYANAAIAQAVANLVNLRHSREDELDADRLGVRFMGRGGLRPARAHPRHGRPREGRAGAATAPSSPRPTRTQATGASTSARRSRSSGRAEEAGGRRQGTGCRRQGTGGSGQAAGGRSVVP